MILLFLFSNWQDLVFEALPNFIPEYILITGIVFLIFSILIPKINSWLPYFVISILGIEISFILPKHQEFFQGMIYHSKFYQKIAYIGAFGNIITVIFSQITLKKSLKPEYWIYILASQLGLQILALSQNWILSFIAFELISFVGYLLVLTYKKNASSAESAIKYFIYGAFASAIMLYGISLYYGIHGNVMLKNEWQFTSIEKIAWSFIGVGIFFKLSIIPFHFWTPEVYHGAPAAIGAWLTTVSKLAGITLFYTLFPQIIPSGLQYALWALSILNMFLGNLGILSQNHIYRLMGYSSIAHSGFLLMTLTIKQPIAQASVLFYVLFSIPITFLTFYSVFNFSEITQNTNFLFWKGIGKNYPWFTTFLLLGLAGLIGLPPTVGFIAKFYLIVPVWQEYINTQNIFVLGVLISFVINTLLALAAYSRIAILLLLRNSDTEKTQKISTVQVFGGILSILILLFGIWGFDKILQLLI